MGKQATVNRVALANALNTTGTAKAPPPLKEPQKPPPREPKPKKVVVPEEPVKTKKEIEEEQRLFLEEQKRKKAEFYEKEALKKLQECKPADESVTYVEDKDSRKPVAIQDISEHWVTKLSMCPFLPNDNVGPVELPPEVDVNERLQYLQLLNSQLEQLLRMSFHVFWSQVLFDKSVVRTVDSYLRFSLRSHDVDSAPLVPDDTLGFHSTEERRVGEQINRRVLAVLRRLSAAHESTHDYLSDAKFAEYIEKHEILDIPKLIDVCAIYGDTHRDTVTRMVHSLFENVPFLMPQFKTVIQHMHNSLLECCRPLSGGTAKPGSLSLDDCLAFLPDVLCCFNSIFCCFPEETVKSLLTSSLEMSGTGGDAGIDLAELMLVLYTALDKVDEDSVSSEKAKLAVTHQVQTIRSLLCRLLSCILGFRMAPRHGAQAFTELLEWCQDHAGVHQDFLRDLGPQLENLMVEWLASGLVDQKKMDSLEQLCGHQLQPEIKGRRRAVQKVSQATGSAGGSSASQANGRDAANDRAKIREVREVVGSEFGDGYILQCLLYYGGSVPAVLENILEGSLPPQLASMPQGLKIGEDPHSVKPEKMAPGADDKDRVMTQLQRMEQNAAALAAEADEYNDDYDDTLDAQERFNVGGNRSDSEKSNSDGDDESSGEGESDGGHKGKGKGRGGKGKGKDRGPVQGQTYAARRKETNKSRVANHNRRDGALRKMQRGM